MINKKCYKRNVIKIVDKAWGEEIWISNSKDYCGKLLRFKLGAKMSLHFHCQKAETFFCSNGRFKLTYIDTDTAQTVIDEIFPGEVVEIPIGCPHQLECLDTGGDNMGEIIEFSTQHFDEDSYRVAPGDNQKVVDNEQDRV